MIDDGCQQEVELISPDRNIIAATFTQFLLKNIGKKVFHFSFILLMFKNKGFLGYLFKINLPAVTSLFVRAITGILFPDYQN